MNVGSLCNAFFTFPEQYPFALNLFDSYAAFKLESKLCFIRPLPSKKMVNLLITSNQHDYESQSLYQREFLFCSAPVAKRSMKFKIKSYINITQHVFRVMLLLSFS